MLQEKGRIAARATLLLLVVFVFDIEVFGVSVNSLVMIQYRT
jgi:hypothetical protein